MPGQRIILKEQVGLLGCIAGRKPQIAWGVRSYRPHEIMIPWQGFQSPTSQPAIAFDGVTRMHGARKPLMAGSRDLRSDIKCAEACLAIAHLGQALASASPDGVFRIPLRRR